MRLGDLDALKEKAETVTLWNGDVRRFVSYETVDNAPTVEAYPFEQVQELVKLNQQFAQEIENLKKPQGEWIEKVERRGCFAGDKTVYSYTCPFCGVTEFKKYPFCHCGADMRGAE